ncbi:NAD-dependent deacetylase [Comamonas testosteroni]|uniref:NAD-dependent protein deacetylase n=1 Tax=Comamonas testosteroni TaxID=285 RepID=A0A0L7N9A2_COMTE|nr:NAD-dependent protein deacetylase [Comamonas testosteroni]KOC30413.1 NAD-dependent deacetylase [Comamonas testosteroni]KWT66592.1 NAD-dependent protein deacetylase of SIR2 family [Comamonas testosteroni]MDN5504095.1 NAD-dependent protein deacetylase [Comamonas sp.]
MSETLNHCVDALALWRLQDWLHAHPRVVVIGGAGCSTEVGIPDYRDRNGQWKRPQPVTYQAFMGDVLVRQRYWARSMLGWRVMGQARPGAAHQALARLEQQGRLELLITQNVDGLHDAAGSLNIVDLHGRIDTVRCMDCDKRSARADLQQRLLALNPAWAQLYAAPAPDGDADLEGRDFSGFVVPACPHCGTGLIKPDVVFFGETVPRERVQTCMAAVARADAVLIAGSSLMVYSGYRFALAAHEQGKSIVAINQGVTRADALLAFKVEADVGQVLMGLIEAS